MNSGKSGAATERKKGLRWRDKDERGEDLEEGVNDSPFSSGGVDVSGLDIPELSEQKSSIFCILLQHLDIENKSAGNS